jgi:hypothetical protein
MGSRANITTAASASAADAAGVSMAAVAAC